MRRRDFLLGVAAAAGCGRNGYGWESSPDRRRQLAQLGGPPMWVVADQEIQIVPRGAEIPFDNRPHSIVVLERGPVPNRIFCEVLFSAFRNTVYEEPYSVRSAYDSTLGFREIVWHDSRPLGELQFGGTDYATLLQHFNFEKAREYASEFDLFGTAGPWIISTYPANRRSVLLDFYGLPPNRLAKAIANWKLQVIDPVFWTEIRSQDWAVVNLLASLDNARKEGLLLQVSYNGRVSRY